ncbi:PaaI family thioesterase [Anaeromyxobacter oryzae]|uniref:Phenylacetic acid degradation protein n=1 Tax=Anaeromyxobacter oryzae TaxID=2918170 RepID=A0ABM7WNX5_9BACT|nr:PaaI family thioesterase [Anaeromyxobacter oryzae]BDG01166.1 phenylacetic acid degradation protein [Anaeromyxobacter oryzae]
MADLRTFLSTGDRFAAGVGIELVEVREGFARARLELGPQHLNAAGVVQGGVVFTLADLAFAAASNSHGTVALAVSATISFVKATRGGGLVAEAREEALSRRLSTCTVRVTDEAGALVALFSGSAYRKDDPMPPP